MIYKSVVKKFLLLKIQFLIDIIPVVRKVLDGLDKSIADEKGFYLDLKTLKYIKDNLEKMK